MSTTATDGERMQCMEVWGGNLAADKAFETPGLQAWLTSVPYEHARQGGDVYYVSSCASGRITRLLLADVSGHGAGVSELAVTLRDLMRGNVNLINQSRFVAAMNQQFLDAADDGGFATALVMTFFAPTQTLQLCNAGHPSPLLYRVATNTWSLITQPDNIQGPADLPLGVLGEADYSKCEVRLKPGDAVLCYSDAFSEAANAAGEMLGVNGLMDLVRSLEVVDPSRFLALLRERIDAMQPDNLDSDDSTAVLIRANGTGATMRDNVLSLFRLLRKPRDNTRLRSATAVGK